MKPLDSLYIDTHMHTVYSPDSNAAMSAMCEAAISCNLSAIAITDHVEIPAFYQNGYDQTLAGSFRDAGEVAKQYSGRLRIAQGIELGEPMHDVALSEKVLHSYDFDFVLASVHNLRDDTDFYFYDYITADLDTLFDRYFAEILETVTWGRFHSLAHLTYPFRYVPANRRPADYRRWQEAIDEILRLVAYKGLALEINTSGYRQSIGKPLPDESIVRRFRELGGERITLGSDAHTPEDVGKNIGDGMALAAKAGFLYVAYYVKGKPEMIAIPGI